jgi:hypothetical protein
MDLPCKVYKLQSLENIRLAGPVGADKDRERIRLNKLNSFDGLEIFDDQAFDLHGWWNIRMILADARETQNVAAPADQSLLIIRVTY